ncbi:MAG: branched-chain-amino-acid transaminase [Methanotrichaceae archaeon]|nr:branched-chain-amino-acid transaminase [Methanotrichaceae archaeon]
MANTFPKAPLLIYIDGKYFPENEAKISVYDHGLLYGDGVFEGIRAYDGYVLKLDEHMSRLYSSAKAIDLEIPLSKEKFKEAVIQTIRKNNLKNAYIRVVVTRGYGDLGLNPRNCPKPTMIIIADYIPPLFEGLNVTAIISSTRRNAVTALNPMIKSMNYLNNILAKIEANRCNVHEAIMLNQNGTLSEGTGDNLFIVKDGMILTPPPSAAILLGITRAITIQFAQKEGIEVVEREITVHELITADEAFLTGTAAEIAPLVEVDGKKIGNGKPGPITSKLMDKFKEIRKTGIPVYS